MSTLYIVVTNGSSVVVGKDIIVGDTASTVLTQRQSTYPLLTFTSTDEATFTATTFVGPNYLLS